MSGGRPTTYDDDMLNKALEYLENYEGVVPSVVGLCRYINRSRAIVYDWANQDGKEAFSDILCQISELQEEKLINGGLESRFNPAITKMMMAKHGYSDKIEQDHTSSDGTMTPTHPGYVVVNDEED